MPDEAGFQINKRFYPFPTGFRLGDPVLVEALTGLTWADFVQRLPDDDVDQAPDDPVVMLGLIGVAISQANPNMTRQRVVAYTARVGMEQVEFISGDTPDELADEGDARPPAIPGSTGSSESPSRSKSDSPTTTDEESSSGPSTPPTSGGRTSVTSLA